MSKEIALNSSMNKKEKSFIVCWTIGDTDHWQPYLLGDHNDPEAEALKHYDRLIESGVSLVNVTAVIKSTDYAEPTLCTNPDSTHTFTTKQVLALRCIFADALGAFQNKVTPTEHDWKNHLLSLQDLKDAFPSVLSNSPETEDLHLA
ncbi:hypothetical protein [Iodobacter fluviatilis]|uniref:Uncharacterized protein n=2 Tax=Iodobacter fluviatilis TaxID=537 RepID=A0A377Q4B5_9NEIS|nr:hypothetical protein [Iodobacter fluviatilis]TCU84599.1 hypothetical protein EV682_109124 [Iodobacter fluviatilis]STQ90064.1 Uncharacterised protein [Iodobacter fluviatilis]